MSSSPCSFCTDLSSPPSSPTPSKIEIPRSPIDDFHSLVNSLDLVFGDFDVIVDRGLSSAPEVIRSDSDVQVWVQALRAIIKEARTSFKTLDNAVQSQTTEPKSVSDLLEAILAAAREDVGQLLGSNPLALPSLCSVSSGLSIRKMHVTFQAHIISELAEGFKPLREVFVKACEAIAAVGQDPAFTFAPSLILAQLAIDALAQTINRANEDYSNLVEVVQGHGKLTRNIIKTVVHRLDTDKFEEIRSEVEEMASYKSISELDETLCDALRIKAEHEDSAELTATLLVVDVVRKWMHKERRDRRRIELALRKAVEEAKENRARAARSSKSKRVDTPRPPFGKKYYY